MSFLVRFEDETTTVVHGADAYEQEGPLTTFFDRNGGGRLASAFTMRLASFRTGRIIEVRKMDPAGAMGDAVVADAVVADVATLAS